MRGGVKLLSDFFCPFAKKTPNDFKGLTQCVKRIIISLQKNGVMKKYFDFLYIVWRLTSDHSLDMDPFADDRLVQPNALQLLYFYAFPVCAFATPR